MSLILQLILIAVIVSLINGVAGTVVFTIKKIAKKLGLGFWLTVVYIFKSPVKVTRAIKSKNKSTKANKAAKEIKNAKWDAVVEYLLGGFADSRPEVLEHPKVKALKGKEASKKLLEESEKALKAYEESIKKLKKSK